MNVFELLDEHYKMQQGGTWEKQQAKVKAEKDAKLKLLLQDKDFLNNLKEQSKNSKSKEVNLKASDATKVVIKNRPEIVSKSARNKTDKEIAEAFELRLKEKNDKINGINKFYQAKFEELKDRKKQESYCSHTRSRAYCDKQ